MAGRRPSRPVRRARILPTLRRPRRRTRRRPLPSPPSPPALASPMLWFSPKLPVDNEERLWVDEGFARLEKMLGRSRLLDARVILPNPEYFPDAYDGSEAAAEILFRRVCDYMQVDRRRLK